MRERRGFADRIIVDGLRARAVIGVDDEERVVAQEVVIRAVLFTDLRAAGETDDPESIVDYSVLAGEIVRYVEASRHYLLEALAERIAAICLADTRVARARIRVEKPGALDAARAAAVEIERRRQREPRNLAPKP